MPGCALDVRDAVADERFDVARDEDGVDTGPLERFDVVARRVGELRDRKLAGGDVKQQLEDTVERRLFVVSRVGGQEDDLGVDALQRLPELAVVPDPNDNLEPQFVTALDAAGERVLLRYGEHDGIGGPGVLGVRTVREQRQQRLRPNVGVRPSNDDALGTTLLRTPRAFPVTDVHQHGDAVTLRDRLAQTSVAHGGGCYPAATIAYARPR